MSNIKLPLRLPSHDEDFSIAFPNWYICDGTTNDLVLVRPRNDRWRGVTFQELAAMAIYFGTSDINVHSEYEGALSDVTPGGGFDAYLEIRAEG